MSVSASLLTRPMNPPKRCSRRGFTNYWDAYFAGRAAPLGSGSAWEVVRSHCSTTSLPVRWPDMFRRCGVTTSRRRLRWRLARQAARRTRRLLGDHVDSSAASRLDPSPRAGSADVRRIRAPIPDDVVDRLFHAASLLACAASAARTHRGPVAEGVGGLEAHVLLALDMGILRRFGRSHEQLARSTMRDRDLIGDGWLSDVATNSVSRRSPTTSPRALRTPRTGRTRRAHGHARAARDAPRRRPAL